MNDQFSKSNKTIQPYILFLGAIALVIAGFTAGVLWTGSKYPIMKAEGFRQLSLSYDRILDDYLNGAEPKQLIDGAAEGMVAALEDPYSQYMVEEAGEAYTQSYEGQFYGIGTEMRQEEGKYIIQSVVKGTPAEKAGLLPGDEIVAVDGETVAGKSFQQLLALVRGEEGTSITLTLIREGEKGELDVSMKRAAIPVHTVTSERLAGNIAHITITRFAERTAEEFKEELDKLEQEGKLEGLLLDLRSNPGGLLPSTIDIANILIPDGKTILNVVYKNERNTVTFHSKQEKEWTIPIVVLVNGQSASASEVLAAALKESANAIIVGEKTYGKGVVQAFSQFQDMSVLSLTVAQWKTPGGTWINKEGVHPDIEAELPEFASLRPLAIGTKMEQGSFGEDVKTMQQMLEVLGYGPVTQQGLFDESTTEVLKKFQQKEKLEASGKFNDKTGYRMLDLLREKLHNEDTQLKTALQQFKKK